LSIVIKNSNPESGDSPNCSAAQECRRTPDNRPLGGGLLAVIFDMDGVLVDSYRAHHESWRALAEEHGIGMSEARFAELFGRTSREIIGELWRPGMSEQRIAAMDARKEGFYRAILEENFPAMDGAVALIDSLVAAGFALAVGSSGPPENIELSLQKLGRAQCFGACVTGMDVARGKPDPEVFLLAAERLGVKPSQCAVIEDAPAGIAAARAAGMTAMALTGTALAAKLGTAHLVVDSLRELTPERIAALIRTRQ
jgi:beta-phosphoglucomutase